MRNAPHHDRPVTMFVYDEVRDFVFELLLGVTMEEVLALSQVAGLIWEWVQCSLRCSLSLSNVFICAWHQLQQVRECFLDGASNLHESGVSFVGPYMCMRHGCGHLLT